MNTPHQEAKNIIVSSSLMMMLHLKGNDGLHAKILCTKIVVLIVRTTFLEVVVK